MERSLDPLFWSSTVVSGNGLLSVFEDTILIILVHKHQARNVQKDHW